MTPPREAEGTERAWPRVRAPGKVILSGEYGVLTGRAALVMAVDRHVLLGPAGTSGDQPGGIEAAQESDPLIDALLEEAARHAPIPSSPPHFDTSRLFDPVCGKLGLGSSAAKAAALMAGVFLSSREDLSLPDSRSRILEAAWSAHRRAGGGSGADVAACVLGGVVCFELVLESEGSLLCGEESHVGFEARTLQAPERYLPLVVHGGSPISTRDALERLGRAFREGAKEPMSALRRAADCGEHLSLALAAENLEDRDLVTAVKESGEALLDLTESLGLGAGTGAGALRAAAEIAKGFGGAVKPSGAGGGDLVLVFAPSLAMDERRELSSALYRRGLRVLDVGLDTLGVAHDDAPRTSSGD